MQHSYVTGTGPLNGGMVSANPVSLSAFNTEDIPRLNTQRERVRNLMLAASIRGRWLSLDEIAHELEEKWQTDFPEASVSARLRDLRKKQYGSYCIERRPRKPWAGLYEYHLRAPVTQVAVQLALVMR